MKIEEKFQKVAKAVADFTGSAKAFVIGFAIILVWAAFGPKFGWSDTHSLVINTFTTIITFLMVFLIQNSQNHNDRALHIKIDELIISLKDAENRFAGLEKANEKTLTAAEKEIESKIC